MRATGRYPDLNSAAAPPSPARPKSRPHSRRRVAWRQPVTATHQTPLGGSRSMPWLIAMIALAGSLTLAPSSTVTQPTPKTDASPRATATTLLAGLPISFEPNLGQADAEVRFITRSKGYSAAFGDDFFAYMLSPAHPEGEPESTPGKDTEVSVVKLSFLFMNDTAAIAPGPVQAGTSNYFIGSDASKWIAEAPNYSSIRYLDAWEGIDIVVRDGDGHQVEHDFVVAPGADPARILMRPESAGRVFVNGDGDLVFDAGSAQLVQRRPIAFQEQDGRRTQVDAHFDFRPSGELGIGLGNYDRSLPLTIDPVSVAYSSYLGGTSGDYGQGVAIDGPGNAYITGFTFSTNYPTTSPFQDSYGGGVYDAVVTKVNSTGSAKVYSTYLGGSFADSGYGVAVDSSGNAYVTGNTASSSNFPPVGAFQGTFGGAADTFVTKINPAGSALVYSSFLGGSSTDEGFGIAVDAGGNAYVGGRTFSSDFPTTSPFQGATGGTSDGFIAKVNAAGSAKTYSSYIGGSSADIVRAVAVDLYGSAVLTGLAMSSNFPTTTPLQGALSGSSDAFVTRVNAAGTAKVYSTFLGGSGDEEGKGVAVDTSGNAYIVGQTSSANFPTASPAQGTSGGGSDAFLTKFNLTGSAMIYSTYLGGTAVEDARAVAVDQTDNAYVAGITSSSDFPVASPFQGSFGGGADVFVTKFNSSGSTRVYSSFLGGSSSDVGRGIGIDGAGNAFVSGGTSSTNFPVVLPFQGSFGGGGEDIFITKITPPVIRANTTSASAQSVGPANRPDVSNSGSFVSFHSPAGDLVAGDTNGVGDVFVKATITGTIERISVATDGTEGNGGSIVGSITPDSRYVTYFSQATNLVLGDTNGVGDIFLRDRLTNTTERISVASDESQSNGASRFPQISPDSRYVVFQSEATNLVAGDTNGKWDIFLRDRTLGTTERISVASDGSQSDKASARPSVSDDGNLVTYHSWATNLVASDTNGVSDVFVRNRSGSTTTRASVATDGTEAGGESQFPKISGDGSTVVFHSLATNLVASDSNSSRDVFARVLSGPTTERVSLTDGDSQGDNTSGFADISTDGRYVIFHATATNLVTGDTNALQDIFIRDRTSGTTKRGSLTHDGSEANDISGMSAISGDGGHIVYQSRATNLVTGDSNSAQDVFYTTRP